MGLVEPLALLFAGFYGVLVLFYLWERWRRQVAVPSLLLWAAVREDTVRVRRFRPDLLFVLQLVLLTCLIGGLARPYLAGAGGGRVGGRLIFVLDTSASMQAREGYGARFEQARAAALQQLRGLHAEEVMLITAGHAPEVVLNFTRDHEAVARALEAALPADTGGDLLLALSLAEGARQRSDLSTDLLVFTDLERGQLPPPLRDRVTVFQSGESDDNLGIAALQVFQGRFQDYRRARAHVLVENFAHREKHGFLTVRVEDRVVHRNGFTIAARESKGFLVHDFPQPGRVEAQLEVADALAADNVAFGWIRTLAPARVLLVSPASPLVDELSALAAATSGLQLATIDPGGFRGASARDFDLVIFHRFVPAKAPAKNALYIYPPQQNPLFPAAGDAENIEVLDWNAEHVTLQGLRPFAALPLQRARIIAPPKWSQALLRSRIPEREFPLAFAGEHGGRRLACITFDVEAERLLGSDNVNFVLFFMNLLGWLAPAADEVAVVRTGEVLSFDDHAGRPLRVSDPHGATYTLPAGQATVEPLFVGEYRIGWNGTQRTLLANFFDARESDIGRASKEPPVFQARAAGPGAAHGVPRAEYGAWLYWAAAALFLLEWVVARRAKQ